MNSTMLTTWLRLGFRLIRVAAGPRGSETSGEYRLDEERTTFNRSIDTQVVVHFLWEGAPGVHRLMGRWRAPGGGQSSVSEFEYRAQDRRFGAFWTLPLSVSTPLGSWTVDATIDGLPAGSLAFDVVDAPDAVVPVARRPLAPQDIFERLGPVFVSIERPGGGTGLFESRAGLADRGRQHCHVLCGKVDFRPGSTSVSQWEVPVPARAGAYRVDAILGETTMWRGFVRIDPK